MEEPSELENYLRREKNRGTNDSEGKFTLSSEKALAKLAEFQLPFAGAWAIKIIQAIVASGVETEIRVKLKRKESEFLF